MGNLRRWSSSASGNSSVAGGANTINFAEGQAPGSVNNSAREMMAQVRGIYTPSEWGWVEFSATASVASQTTIKLTGNQTSDWTAGRRWRLKSASTTRYGSVVSSSFTAETTITVTVDSGSLSASHSLAALAAIDSNHVPGFSSYARLASANTFTATQTINDASLLLNSNSDYTPQTQLTHAGATAGSAAYSMLNRARGTYTSPTIVSSGDQLGNVLFQGYDGSAYRSAASIEAQVDGTPGANDMPGRLTFKTTPDGSTAATERMRIDSSGNVGIGGTPANYASYTNLSIDGTDANLDMLRGGVRQFAIYTAATQVVASTISNVPLKLGANNVNFVNLGTDQSLTLTGTGGLGYGTGSGGTVPQTTSKTNGVTINKTNGQIVTDNALMAGGAEITFTVTNSTVAATDTIILHRASGGGAGTNGYLVYIDSVAAGSFVVYMQNLSGTNKSENITLNFAVIKAVTA